MSDASAPQQPTEEPSDSVKVEFSSLTSTEGESEVLTTIEILKLFDDNEPELTSTAMSDDYAKIPPGGSGASSSATARKYLVESDDVPEESGGGCGEYNSETDGENIVRQGQHQDEDEEDDDTLSSEAFVDDIELILMPEGTEDLPEDRDNSPKLVRVTELGDEEYEEDDCDFRKMDASERSDRELETPHANYTGENSVEEYEDEEEAMEGAVGLTHSISKSEVYVSFEDDDRSCYSYHSGEGSGRSRGERKYRTNSGVQTDITALEKDCFGKQPSFDFKSRKAFLGGSVKASGSGRASHPVKKLNWKSELTLLPSKTKIGSFGYGASYGALIKDSNDRDQYSSRVTKFTSQDNVLSSSSQFLKPSTLYRTRNLSRNLNHFGSSETTLVLPMTETTATESTRYRDRIYSSTTSTGTQFKGAPSTHSYHLPTQGSFSSPRSQLSSFGGPSTKNFRSSLPDLSSSGGMHHQDNKRRQSQKSMRGSQLGGSSSSSRLRGGRKKSSSDDETSSLIDESERCLRSSIDLLLTDDYSSPGSEYPYRHFSSGSFRYSSRRSCSQPILTDQGYCAEPRDVVMGSPFLPRKLSDMRCSKWAKVILPNGQVSVVAVRDTDEVKDILTVHTDTGCVLNLPFRKVVFAWRTKR